MLRQVIPAVMWIQCLSTIPALKIPTINNTVFIARDRDMSAVRTLYNTTCDQCLCRGETNDTILNCFPDGRCEYFYSVPLCYQLESLQGARLFFLQGVLPKESLSSTPNVTDLVQKLRNGARRHANIAYPRCLLFDRSSNVLVTVSHGTNHLHEYNATDLTPMRKLNLGFPQPRSLAENKEMFYVGYNEGWILLIDKRTFTISGMINSTHLSGIRDIMFLNGGEIMVVAATMRHSVVFFERADGNALNTYEFLFNQTFDSISPHGLFYLSDAFFYVSSWYNNQVYLFTKTSERYWNPKLIIDESSQYSNHAGAHVIVDESHRLWFALNSHGLRIYDRCGAWLESYLPDGLTTIFHAIITEDYVLYVADSVSNQILRIDPNTVG